MSAWLNRRAIAAVTLLAAGLSADPVRAGGAARTVLRFESSPSGELGVVARGADVTAVLDGIAERTGIEVVADENVTRPPLTMTVPLAPLDELLAQMLHGRNYAVVYDSDTDAVSHVILLAPSESGRPRVPPKRPPRKTKVQAPVVIRN